MNNANKETVLNLAWGLLATTVFAIILVLHNTWGDGRYVQKEAALTEQIARIDIELTIIDQRILYAESERQKKMFESIRDIYAREKEGRREELSKQ